MPDHVYSVKFNRAESAVEVAGPDKEWVEEQFAELLPRLDTALPEPSKRTQAPAEAARAAGGATKPRRPRRSSAAGGLGANDELAAALTEEVTNRLESYMAERPAVKSAQDQAPVLAAFLADELHLEDVSAEDLGTVYKVMGWKIPGVPKALKNGTDRKQYFTRARGRFRLTRHGLNYARIDSKALASGDR